MDEWKWTREGLSVDLRSSIVWKRRNTLLVVQFKCEQTKSVPTKFFYSKNVEEAEKVKV